MIEFEWKSAIWAGIIAGLIFVMLEMIMIPIFLDESPWESSGTVAAIAIGYEGTTPTTHFAPGVFVVAMTLHMMLSIVFAVMFAIVIAYVTNSASFGSALAIGGILGLILYVINLYAFTELFPWFARVRSWVTMIIHIIFGIVAVLSYAKLKTSRSLKHQDMEITR